MLFIQRIALHEVLPEDIGGPLPEVGTTQGLHPVANGDDDIKIIVLDSVVFTVSSSCQGILDN